MIPKPEDMKCPICGGRLYDQGKNRAIAERCSHGDDFKAVVRFYSCGHCGRDIGVLSRKLSGADLLNRIGNQAILQNLDVARKYVSKEDLEGIAGEALNEQFQMTEQCKTTD